MPQVQAEHGRKRKSLDTSASRAKAALAQPLGKRRIHKVPGVKLEEVGAKLDATRVKPEAAGVKLEEAGAVPESSQEVQKPQLNFSQVIAVCV